MYQYDWHFRHMTHSNEFRDFVLQKTHETLTKISMLCVWGVAP